jgi:hypothetical protein
MNDDPKGRMTDFGHVGAGDYIREGGEIVHVCEWHRRDGAVIVVVDTGGARRTFRVEWTRLSN